MHDKSRFERGQEMLNSLISKLQRERTEAAITQLRVQWAKTYGDRLPTSLADILAIEAATHDEIIQAGYGYGPATEQAFRSVAQEVADAQPLVKRALDLADAKLKAEIRDQKLSEIPATKRMQMAREGTLEGWLEDAVAAELDDRHARRAA